MAVDDLQFGGAEQFSANRERLFHAATDLESIARIIPDVESSEPIDDHSARVVVRPGFSFLRGKLTLTIRRTSVDSPTAAEFEIHSKGIGVLIIVAASLAFAEEENGSRLDWNARVVEIKGLAATLGRSLIRGAAEQVIGQCWQKLREELGEGAK
jgi:carbon monoxide dehydrogenase subunit G